MKLFGINFGSKKAPQISSIDREWVEGNFQWLVSVFGKPKPEQISITDKWFPKTFKAKQFSIDNLIVDFCNQLDLDPSQFDYAIRNDIRDTSDIPYALKNNSIDCLIHFDKETNKYRIELAKSVLNHPNWMVSNLCYEFSKVKLIESKVGYDTGNDTNLFIYLAAVFFGYGLIIGNNLTNTGTKRDGFWVDSWNYAANIPYQVMAYALAALAKIQNNDSPDWKNELPKNLRKEFDLSMNYLKNSKNKILDTKRIDGSSNVKKLLKKAYDYYQLGEFSKAIDILRKIILLTDDNEIQSIAYHNIGYYKIRLGEFENSIPDFEKALTLNTNCRYANDNLGFALIMSGKLEKGRQYIDKAMLSGRNNQAYSYRNLALYYQKKGEFDVAKSYFMKAFDLNTPVDLLDYYYGQFLIQMGKEKEGLEHIKISADLGEKEGIEMLKQL